MRKLFLFCMLSFFISFNTLAAENEKRYRIELVLFQKTNQTSDLFVDRGEPDLTDALPFVALPASNLVLQKAKQQISKQYTPILHEAWLQTLGTKTSPTKVRVVGGKKLEDGRYEVKGTLQILPGRQLFVDADLAILNGTTSTRFETIMPITQDELNYIHYANYAMILLVGPAVTPRVAQ